MIIINPLPDMVSSGPNSGGVVLKGSAMGTLNLSIMEIQDDWLMFGANDLNWIIQNNDSYFILLDKSTRNDRSVNMRPPMLRKMEIIHDA